jgi:TonB family protein
MKRAHTLSAAAVLALAVAVGAAAGEAGTARAAQQKSAVEPPAGRGDAGASLIQLEVVVTASGGGEGTVRTWRVTTTTRDGPSDRTSDDTATGAIDLSAAAHRSSDGAIILDFLRITARDPTENTLVLTSTVRDLVLRDGERTVVLEATDPNGSVTLAVTAAALDDPAGQRAAGSAAPIRVGDGVPPPRKVHDVSPVYPSAARTLRVQGLVILEATIGPTGEVVDVEVLRSVPELDAAAVAAVEQWRYEPTLVDGEAVPVVMTVTINFGLPGDEAPRRLPPPAGEPAQPAESPGSGGTALESAIFGQVLDAAGEPLPGTTIAAAVAGAARAARVEVADRQGEYRISNLPPGTYTVIFHLPGFRAVVRNEVVVGSGLAARVDAVLAVGMAVGTDEGVVRILPLGVDESVVSGPLGPPGDAALIR